MGVKEIINTMRKGNILCIDPSTHSFAFAIAEKYRGKNRIVAAGKVSFPKDSSFTQKCRIMNAAIDSIFKNHPITHTVIEQTIYIANPQTSRLLSYVVGCIWGKCATYKVEISDIGPIQWKKYLGYKNVSKVEIDLWKAEMGRIDANKKVKFEKKERVRRIIIERIPSIEPIVSDDDILDAVGIGIWAIHHI